MSSFNGVGAKLAEHPLSNVAATADKHKGRSGTEKRIDIDMERVWNPA